MAAINFVSSLIFSHIQIFSPEVDGSSNRERVSLFLSLTHVFSFFLPLLLSLHSRSNRNRNCKRREIRKGRKKSVCKGEKERYSLATRVFAHPCFSSLSVLKVIPTRKLRNPSNWISENYRVTSKPISLPRTFVPTALLPSRSPPSKFGPITIARLPAFMLNLILRIFLMKATYEVISSYCNMSDRKWIR